jgi:hypothetical protein
MPEYRDKRPGALAHGPAMGSDIERVRRNVDEADARRLRAEELSVARHRRQVSDRVAAHEESTGRQETASDSSPQT